MTKAGKNKNNENGCSKITDVSRELYYLVKYYGEDLRYYPELTGYSNCEMYENRLDLKCHLLTILEQKPTLSYKGLSHHKIYLSNRSRLQLKRIKVVTSLICAPSDKKINIF